MARLPDARPVPLAVREVYCPQYCGNANEAMWPRERARYLAEVQSWGFNRYADSLMSFDVGDPHASAMTFGPEIPRSLGAELLSRKLAGFRSAAALGMELDAHVWPNHAYLDQFRTDLAVVRTAPSWARSVVGQLLCPSKPEAREIILGNFERAFRELADREIPLASLTPWTYDYGGCACDRCAPWIVTYAGLVDEIRAVARTYYPAIEVSVLTWWWSDDEYRLFGEWLARQAPGWPQAMVFHIPYNATVIRSGVAPAGCRVEGFVHLGYGDVRGNDTYERYGPSVAAQRIPATLADLTARGARGLQAFSEGMFDDVNKALVGALSAGQASSADEILREYARRYFAADEEAAGRWARWLAAWGDRSTVDLQWAAAELDALARSATPGWRLEQFRSKLALEELDRRLSVQDAAWDADRLEAAERFEDERERLWHGVYGLGPTRFHHSPAFLRPVWYEGWQTAREGARQTTI